MELYIENYITKVLILAMMVDGIWLTICILSVFMLIASISSGHGGGFYGGGSSFGGGGSSGGGGTLQEVFKK